MERWKNEREGGRKEGGRKGRRGGLAGGPWVVPKEVKV